MLQYDDNVESKSETVVVMVQGRPESIFEADKRRFDFDPLESLLYFCNPL